MGNGTSPTCLPLLLSNRIPFGPAGVCLTICELEKYSSRPGPDLIHVHPQLSKLRIETHRAQRRPARAKSLISLSLRCKLLRVTLPRTVNSVVNGVVQFTLRRRRPFSLPVGDAHCLPAYFHVQNGSFSIFFGSQSFEFYPPYVLPNLTSTFLIVYIITLGSHELLRLITSTNNIGSSSPLLDISTSSNQKFCMQKKKKRLNQHTSSSLSKAFTS